MRAELAVALHGLGLSVLLLDYRGYGGNLAGQRAYATSAAQEGAVRTVRRRPAPALPIEPGAAVAVGLAVQRLPAALAEISVHVAGRGCRCAGCCWTTTRRSSASPLYTPCRQIAGGSDDIVPGHA